MEKTGKFTTLLDRMEAEQTAYRERLLALSPAEILENAPAYVTRLDILEAMEHVDWEEPQLDALLAQDHIMDRIYQDCSAGEAVLDGLVDSLADLAAGLAEERREREQAPPPTAGHKRAAIEAYISLHWHEPAGQKMLARLTDIPEGDEAALAALYREMQREAPAAQKPAVRDEEMER